MVSDVVAVKRIAEFMETNAAFVHHPQITHILAELIILFVKVSAAAADDAATATDTADKECILKIVCGMCEQNRHCADAAIKHPIVTTAQRDAFVDALVVVAENAHFQYSPAIQTKAKNLLFLLATICVSMR